MATKRKILDIEPLRRPHTQNTKDLIYQAYVTAISGTLPETWPVDAEGMATQILDVCRIYAKIAGPFFFWEHYSWPSEASNKDRNRIQRGNRLMAARLMMWMKNAPWLERPSLHHTTLGTNGRLRNRYMLNRVWFENMFYAPKEAIIPREECKELNIPERSVFFDLGNQQTFWRFFAVRGMYTRTRQRNGITEQCLEMISGSGAPV